MSTLTDSEIEELRIAIAQEMGFNRPTGDTCYGAKWIQSYLDALPPYTTSLDAIQQAAIERFKDEDEQARFEVHLLNPTNVPRFVWQLTPIDWCIAFARTARIWRFEP